MYIYDNYNNIDNCRNIFDKITVGDYIRFELLVEKTKHDFSTFEEKQEFRGTVCFKNQSHFQIKLDERRIGSTLNEMIHTRKDGVHYCTIKDLKRNGNFIIKNEVIQDADDSNNSEHLDITG